MPMKRLLDITYCEVSYLGSKAAHLLPINHERTQNILTCFLCFIRNSFETIDCNRYSNQVKSCEFKRKCSSRSDRFSLVQFILHPNIFMLSTRRLISGEGR